MVLSVGTVGALLALRRSSNAIGWMLLAGAAFMAVSFLGSGYAHFSFGSRWSLGW